MYYYFNNIFNQCPVYHVPLYLSRVINAIDYIPWMRESFIKDIGTTMVIWRSRTSH